MTKIRAKISRPEIGSGTLSVSLGVYLALVMNNTFWQNARTYLAGNMSATIALYIAITALLIILTTLVSIRYLTKPLFVLLLLASGTASWFTDSFGVLVDTDMIRNVVETTTAEAKDLITPGFIAHLAAFSGIPAVLLAWIRIIHRPILKKLAWDGGVIVFCATIFAAIGVLYAKPYSAVIRTKRDLVKTLNPITPLVSTVRYFAEAGDEVAIIVKPLGEDAQLNSPVDGSSKPRVSIVVVGETARGANFSLGSYERPTNPLLSQRDVIYFPNMTSCGTATDVSLPCMFSNLKRSGYNHRNGLENETVVDVLARAGIEVTWWDNNTGSKGVADRVPYLNIAGSTDPRFCEKGDCKDGIFVDMVGNWLDNIKKDSVLVLHQLGNHGPAYYERYPEEFRKFKPDCRTSELGNCTDAEIVNSYDNAILYTDYVLSRIIDQLKSRSDRVAGSMLYVSDHGESLGENGLYLHGAPFMIAPDEQTRVPFFVWFDQNFPRSMGVDTSCLKNSAEKTGSHDNLFHSILGMMNVSTRAYDENLDIFAACKAKRLNSLSNLDRESNIASLGLNSETIK